MKLKIIVILLFFSVILLNGQEIKLNATVFASAGNNPEISVLNISKWRLGEVHLIVLQQNDLKVLPAKDWTVRSFPNPFSKMLNLEFIAEEGDTYRIQVTDISGKTILYSEEKAILPHETLTLDLGFLAPSLYLVSISSKDKDMLQVLKVLKH